MKSPLGKLKLKLHKSDARDGRDCLPCAQLDELARASQDMQDMRNCYDSLLSAAAATANSAYEFSESLQEMGSYLLEKTALLDDKGTGKILSMLGKVQFELQKVVDSYRSHIFLTIMNPSESLLNELQTVEDMKQQCDEKRSIYEYMVAQQKEKGRSKCGKGESFTLQQLQSAYSEYNEESTLCIFRLKSLKQGQSRSLLTQAARHHAAQLNFFRKGLKSLEAAEPHVRLFTEQQHIDYQFSGLEDDVREDGEGGGNGNDTNESRKLSFKYRTNKQGQDAVSASRNLMELNLEKNGGGFQVPNREPKGGSHSAPILPERKSDPVERFRQMQQSTARKSQQTTARKSNTYVLPTPLDAKGPASSRTSSSVHFTRPIDLSGCTHKLWHSSPLEQKKHEKASVDCQLQEFTVLQPSAAQKENYSNSNSTQLPPPLLEGVSVPLVDIYSSSDHRKIKRWSFSGSIIGKLYAMKPAFSAKGPIPSAELSQHASRVLSHAPIPQFTSSPKISLTASPPLASSPRISELHELPKPPGNLITKAVKPSASISHSAPLDRNYVPSVANNVTFVAANVASHLPTPPLIVAQSFSITPSSQRAITVNVSKPLESPKVLDNTEDVDSPPLTPISLANINPASMTSE